MKRVGVPDYSRLYRMSIENPDWFWSTFEKESGFLWFSPYSKVIDDKSQGIEWTKWFTDGKFNIAYNCLERQIARYGHEKIAYLCETESGERETVTYGYLDSTTNKIANLLKRIGITKGDVICIVMSNSWRTIAVMLACAKIGAIHCNLFGGLGTQALQSRINSVQPKIITVSARYYRRGKMITPLAELRDTISGSTNIKAVLIDNDSSQSSPSQTNNDPETLCLGTTQTINLRDAIGEESKSFDSEQTSSEDPLFILHTSGTTGKPKAIVHTHAGFAVVAAQQTIHQLDLKQHDTVFWPTDIAWISAHIWVVYGLLLCGGRAVLYDGAVDYPKPNRFFDIIRDNYVTIVGLSPTLVRQLRQASTEIITSYDFSRIKIIALTGEPIDKSSWIWIYNTLGHSEASIFNNSGGTEVGGAILGSCPILPTKAASVGQPQLGFAADVVDDNGNHVVEQPGYLIVRKPWPSMTRGFWKNPSSYLDTYWCRFEGKWYHSDLALIDKEGFWYLLGRVDDVIKVAGHRFSASEIEEILMSHPSVLEAGVVGEPDPVKGQRVVAYVTLKDKSGIGLDGELVQYVCEKFGKIARPEIRLVNALPKTPTGKIMRKALKSLQNSRSSWNDENI
jgi:acetyl-CoA synthetase